MKILLKKNLKLIRCIASNSNLFNSNGKSIKEPSLINNVLNKHEKYCKHIYARNKKVNRKSDPELLNFRNRILNRQENKRMYLDDYDNQCSKDNLREQYPELLPLNFDTGETTLINLANKKLNVKDDSNTFEKIEDKIYYIPVEKLFKEVNNVTITNEDSIFTTDHASPGDEYNLDNNEQLIYYGNEDKISQINNSHGSKIPTVEEIKPYIVGKKDEDTIDTTVETNVLTISRSLGLDYIIKTNLDTSTSINDLKQYIAILNFNKESELKNYLEQPSSGYFFTIKVQKIVDKKVDTLNTCWENIINTYSFQSPGVWLHPFINDIRICLTTYSENKFQFYKNDITHAFKLTNNNYYISQKLIAKDKKPPKIDMKQINVIIIHKMIILNIEILEYFDVSNIPIKENFHLGIILNLNVVEIYINGKLRKSIKLFGKIKYSDGPLQINTGKIGLDSNDQNKQILLGGTINYFKYFPYALRADNMYDIFLDKSSKIKVNASTTTLHEHNHNIEISHEHQHDTELEKDHIHTVKDEHIPQQYYIDN